ncbi:glycosyl hydrolase family 28-related protein [Microbacterium sp.]|uniref:glycosyl hydrolase family 28-related protein n=1 Tax=Microbacterium sp. TaxID=51671 RepID=UPI003A9329EE
MAWELADNIRGPKGDKGDKGTISSVSVATLPAGAAAEVDMSGTTDVHVDFRIPRGDKGEQGVPGTLSSASAESVPAGEQAEVVMSGTTEVKHAHFKVPRGLPGVNAVDNDEAVSVYVGADDTLSGMAVNGKIQDRATTPRASTPGVPAAPLPYINVRDFGATGDGSTDDLPAFQAAFASLGSTGGHVEVPAGHYFFSDSLDIDCEWVRVVCDPDALIETTNISTSTGGHAVAFVGHSGLGTAVTPQREYAEWVGGQIKTNLAGENENALGALRYKQVRVTNLTVPVTGRKAFTAQYGVDDVIVDGMRIGHTGNASISIEEDCNRVTIRNVTIDESDRWGIYLINAAQVNVENVHIETAHDAAFRAAGIDNLRVRGFTSRSSAGHGIHLSEITGQCHIADYDISGIAAGFRGVFAASGTASLRLDHGRTDGENAFAVVGDWRKVLVADVFASAVPAGRDMFEFSALTTRPIMSAVRGSGTSHRSTVAAAAMNGYEPVVIGCSLPTGTATKFSGWKAKLDVVSSSLTALVSLDFPAMPAATAAEMTATVQGAVIGDVVHATPMTAPLETGLVWSAYVSAADTVTLRLLNGTTGSVNPATRQWKFMVLAPA